MAPPPKLPEPLQRVGVQQFVAPSALAVGSVCVLRRQGREEDGSRIAGLIESPWAVVGTLVHRAIQIADGRSNIIEVFEELVRRREIELLEDAKRRHFVPLRAVIGEGGWSSRLGILQGRSGNREPLQLGRPDFKQSLAPSIAHSDHEVWLESELLGFRGSADLLEFIGDHSIRITDWKTGPVLDSNGEVKANYRLQLAAYQMLVRERWPDRKVETQLYNGEVMIVQVTSDDEETVRQSVSKIKRTINGRSKARAEDLALKGAECADCAIRHRCPTYMEELRRTGRGLSAIEGQWSGDILGCVSSSQTQGDTTVVNLTLPSGATAQMRWFSSRMEVSELKGQTVVGFGLIPLTRRSRVDGKILEPLIYEESNHSRRAWQAEIFRL